MHPLDTGDRVADLKEKHGIGYCNITKCCTKVCPEHITITDNAIIPLKERVVDEFYDPVLKLIQLVFGREEVGPPTQGGGDAMFDDSKSAQSPRGHPGRAWRRRIRYRLLNEPEQAESICEDVLRVEPDNQEALATLILALTDRLDGPRPAPPHAARELLPRLHGEYERAYYAGIIDEREGIAWLRSDKPRAGTAAYDCFREAMAHFERAEAVRPPANDDAIAAVEQLRRMIMANPDVAPADEPAEVAADLGE